MTLILLNSEAMLTKNGCHGNHFEFSVKISKNIISFVTLVFMIIHLLKMAHLNGNGVYFHMKTVNLCMTIYGIIWGKEVSLFGRKVAKITIFFATVPL